ncbi:MAG: hypothetical protein HKN73_04150 [Gemmatimonadetes bacterium]|nr:hypothetical protein [Gemmatimonadota bacterium]
MALYHIDHALASDLHPVLVEIGAQPARTLQKGLGLGGQSDGDGVFSAQEVLNGTVAQEVLRPVVERRFRILRRELDRVGTADLSPSRRRASGLHERAVRARGRTAEAIEAWEEFANGVVQHEHRREAVDQLRKELGDQASRLELDVGSHLDATVLQPLKRAEDVLRRALTSLESLEGDDADAVEQGLLEVGEEITTELRRQALAGLRRRLEVEPVRKILQEFDDAVEVKLEGLPESFVVVAPDALPTTDQAVRAYPEPATHAFRLIATGAVERTLRPSLAELGERSQALLAQASDSVQALRESLELRFDAAADAAIEAGRLAARTPDLPVSVREPLEIARSALTSALQDLDALRDRLGGHADEALSSFREDFKALSDRLELQLASARPLEARLQAERARVELEGTAVLRLLLDRGRHIVKLGIQRLGLRLPARTSARPGQDQRRAPLKPGGREGSDRAVLFHILFDETTVAGKVFDGGLILAILASIVVLMLESVESYRMDHGATLAILEWLFTLLFTLEYAARLWAVDRPARYAFSFFGIIDLLAVLPTYLSLIVPGGQYLMGIRMLRVVRAFRVLKLARYVGEAEVLMNALRASRYKITVFLVSVLCVAVVMGSSMYLIEGPSSGFTSIPRGVYWSIVTLTTVGFGDITPQSPLGQTLAAILMVLGYGIIAVPTGIVTAELATASPPSRTVQACRQCGHREQDPAAAFCLVCGDRLTVA